MTGAATVHRFILAKRTKVDKGLSTDIGSNLRAMSLFVTRCNRSSRSAELDGGRKTGLDLPTYSVGCNNLKLFYANAGSVHPIVTPAFHTSRLVRHFCEVPIMEPSKPTNSMSIFVHDRKAERQPAAVGHL